MNFIKKLYGLYHKCVGRKYFKIISNNAEKITDFFFIQIGSNDGITGDPIHNYVIKYKWSGILVEPVKYLFDKLRKNYQNRDNLFFENVAIAEKDGYKNFYGIKEGAKSFIWYDQLGSLVPESVLKFKKYIPNFDDHFVTEKIKCMSFPSLIHKHEVKKIDLLHIDTEGYDYEIIKLIDFNKIKPKMILYEGDHLKEDDKLACMRLLKNQGYSLLTTRFDTFAYLI